MTRPPPESNHGMPPEVRPPDRGTFKSARPCASWRCRGGNATTRRRTERAGISVCVLCGTGRPDPEGEG